MAELITFLRINPIESNPFASLNVDEDFTRLNAIGEFVEFFFQAEEACVITQVGINVEDGSTAGTGGPGSYVATLQGIGPTGLGDGVIKATTGVYTPNNTDSEIFVWLPLIASYSAQRGERLCLRFEQVSGGGSSFGTRVLNGRTFAGGFPCQRVGIDRDASIQIFGYRSATRRYGNPLMFIRRDSVNAPGQTGMRFLLSSDYGQTAILSHITWLGLPSTVAQRTYDVIVYDDMGTELSRTTRDVDLGALGMTATTAGREYATTVYLEEAPEIEFGREYFVVLTPESASQGLVVSGWQFSDADDAAALGLGGEFYLVTRSGTSGAFSRGQTVRPMIDLGFFDWGISAPPQTGYHVKFVARYNDNVLIEHADDQISDVDVVVDGEAFEAPGSPIGGAIKSYGGFATVEVFRNPEGVFDSSTLIYAEMPIEELKLVNWDPFVAGESHLVFRFRAALGSSTYVDVDQYARLVS